jgi:hypothetical protein
MPGRTTNIRFKNIHWKLYRKALIPDEPPHRTIDCATGDCQKLLQLTPAWLIRWPSNWDKEVTSAFWFVIKDHYNGFGEFSRNTRSKIRRGLKRNSVRKINKQELKQQGFPVYRNAFSRYDKASRPLIEHEYLYRLDALDSDRYDFWGVYQDNMLVAYAEIRYAEDVINTSVLKFHPVFLKDYTSYALLYTLIEHYLNGKNIRYITNGARSISHDTNIQNFLIEAFSFRKAYCTLNIYYMPILYHFLRLSYPFRSLTDRLPSWIAGNLNVLLKQEYIRRNSQ